MSPIETIRAAEYAQFRHGHDGEAHAARNGGFNCHICRDGNAETYCVCCGRDYRRGTFRVRRSGTAWQHADVCGFNNWGVCEVRFPTFEAAADHAQRSHDFKIGRRSRV